VLAIATLPPPLKELLYATAARVRKRTVPLRNTHWFSACLPAWHDTDSLLLCKESATQTIPRNASFNVSHHRTTVEAWP
jgi:hypothetical protein